MASEDVTLVATLQAVDDASPIVEELQAQFDTLGTSALDAGDAASAAGDVGGQGMDFLSGMMDNAVIAAASLLDGLSALSDAAGVVGGALLAMYWQVTQSTTSYADSIEKVVYLTGASTQQADGLISAFRDQGFTTDQATMAMQRMEQRLGTIMQSYQATGKVSAQNVQTLKDMGLSIDQVIGSGGNLTDLLPSIIDHLGAMTNTSERARITMQLFGRNFSDVSLLIQAGGAAFAANALAAEQSSEWTRANTDAFIEFKKAEEQTKMALETFTMMMAGQALPVLMALEHAVQGIVTWFHSLSPATQEGVQKGLALAAVFATLIGGGAALEKGLGIVSGLLKMPGIAAFGERLGALLGPIGLVIAIFLALKFAYDNVAAAHTALQPLVEELKGAWDDIQTTLKTLMTTVSTFISLLNVNGDGLKSLALSAIALVVGWIDTFRLKILELNQFLLDHRGQIILVVAQLKIFAGHVMQFLSDAWGPFHAALSAASTIITTVVVPAVTAVTGAILGIVIPAIVTDFFTWLRDKGKEVAEMVLLVAGAFGIYTLAVWAHTAGIAAVSVVQGIWSGLVVAWNIIAAFATGEVTVWAAAQWLLNLAIAANPIGAIIIIIMVLIGAMVLLYNHNTNFRNIVNEVWGVLKGWGGWITGTLFPALSHLGDAFSALGAGVSGMATNIGNAFSALGGGVSNIWNGIVNNIRRSINAIIDDIDRFIGGIDRISIPGIGSVHINQIPRLATGGVFGPGAGGPGLAVIGEGGQTEVVATLTQAMQAGMNAASGGGSGGPITVINNTYLDGKLIAQQVSKHQGNRFRLGGGMTGSAA